jgi:Collagen triple helix repeat (20 copies)
MRRLLLIGLIGFLSLHASNDCSPPLQGPPGPPGPTGFVGERGAAGYPGPAGRNGQNGQNGQPGPQGAQGCQGPRGFQGPAGHIGCTGPKGCMGPMGPTGPTGATGPTGFCDCPTVAARYYYKQNIKRLGNKALPLDPGDPVESFPLGLWGPPVVNPDGYFVTIPMKGTYEIMWIVNVDYLIGANVSIGLSINGTNVPAINTQAGLFTDHVVSSGYLVGTAILFLNTGAQVGAVNVGDLLYALALPGPASSYTLLIVRRGD